MSERLAGGRYTVVRRIAQGGMGEVLLADFPGDAALGLSKGLLVVKRVLADHPNRSHQAAMLREEGRVALRLLHDNLVETFFVDDDRGDPLLVMEFMSGRAMSQVLGQAKKRKEHVPVDVALALLRAAACGLHFAHTLTDGGRPPRPLGLIHRDVSPANIFVTFDGRVKVIDFGVAKANDSEIRTSTGILKGKLGYMSPEHALGEKLTPAADLWSLGVCFWETLCAERLFAMSSPSATLQAISEKPIPPPTTHRPDLPAHITQLCMRLLERRLERRIGSGAALVKAIDALPEARTLTTVDLGGWLSGRFPEEAEQGRTEASRCAKLRRRIPVPIGLVEGAAAQPRTEEDSPTVVIQSSAALVARDLMAGEDDDNAATIRMRLDDVPNEPTTKKMAAGRAGGGLLADAESVHSEAAVDTATATSTSPGLDPQRPLPALSPSNGAPVSAPVAQVTKSGVGMPTVLSTATLPIVDRSSSWVAVALLTFGALALAMGVAFSFLAPRPSVKAVAAFEDPGGFDVLVATVDAPPNAGARAIELDKPATLKIAGGQTVLEPEELRRRLDASGVLLRAALPTTTRGTLAILLPVLIAGLGLLALAVAIPALASSRAGPRIVAQAVLVLGCAVAVGAVLKLGALSWPGVDAFRAVPRLELR